jgi:tRNA-specific 2-thiouridylase
VFRTQAQTRYRQRARDCTVTISEAQVTVTFDEPQRAVTPGQFVVFYDGPRCLGGAVIEAASAPAAGLRPAVSA